MYQRTLLSDLERAILRDPPLIQVLVGPRQVGKSTIAQQLCKRLGLPHHIASADSPVPFGPEWVETQWRIAAARAPDRETLLVLDEVQKIRGWSETVKSLWDRQKRGGPCIRVLLLGSSALLVQKGLTESLAGRFFLHRCTHWNFEECRAAFGWTLDRWLFFGGYPGAAPFAEDETSWKRYVGDSLIETVLARDVLQLQTVAKPALLRHLFFLAATFPAQVLSYNKMLGQLQEAGNTTTLAHYLRLLETAFLLSGLELFSRGTARKRGSSPKLVLWNNALVNACALRTFGEAVRDGAWWGRLVENAVGAHLLNHLGDPAWSVTYWRRGGFEVDFVVRRGNDIWAIEVKGGSPGKGIGAISQFRRDYPTARPLLIGAEGVPLEEYFSSDPTKWLEV